MVVGDLAGDVEGHLAAAADALASILPLDDPLFPLVVARARRRRGLPADVSIVLDEWSNRHTSEMGRARYPWSIGSTWYPPYPSHIGAPTSWTPWRPRDRDAIAEDPSGFESRLLLPLILATTIEALGAISDEGGHKADLARALLDASWTKVRRDIAAYVLERHAWGDTWALWCLARNPRALRALHPFALVIASAYAARACETGVVVATRFPFHGGPLASASAQLAAGLIALGIEPVLVGHLARSVRAMERPDGGWGDADGPSDVLTTLVAGDLLAGLDPTFDPAPATTFLAACQRRDGLWRAYGPEAAWLTESVTEFLEAVRQPFAERFRSPGAGVVMLDPRTGLPRYEHYATLADLTRSVDGLGAAPFSVAFLDLIGFRAFNNALGMEQGDLALGEFAAALRTIPATIAIRDGGDEFLVVGTPGGEPLGATMAEFLASWPGRFRARFGADAPMVAPRILVGTAAGSDLVALRNRLGREIGALKARRGATPLGFIEEL